MTEISREQFNVQLTNAVRTTINLLEDAALFEEEVASIIGTVTPPLRRLTRKVIRASKSRGDSWGAKFIPRHVGALYGPAMLVKDVGDEPDGDENRDDEADDADERGLVILQPSSPYLFLKIVFYEPPAASDEPYLIFGRIRELVSKTANRRITSPITIKRNRIKHLLSEIQPKSANRLIPTRATFRSPG